MSRKMGPHPGTNQTLGLHRRVGGLWRKEGPEGERQEEEGWEGLGWEGETQRGGGGPVPSG